MKTWVSVEELYNSYIDNQQFIPKPAASPSRSSRSASKARCKEMEASREFSATKNGGRMLIK
jgi:hypothetical protein